MKLDPRIAPKLCVEYRYVMSADGHVVKPSGCLMVVDHIGMHFDGEVHWGGSSELATELEIQASKPLPAKRKSASGPITTTLLGDH